MSTAMRTGAVAALVAVAMAAAGCGGGHDSFALYNDAGNTVRVLGCAGCGAAGKEVAAGRWLSLNMPPDRTRLAISQPGRTTCLVLMSGTDSGRPFVVKVSEAATSVC